MAEDICSVEDCGSPVRARSYCNMHYTRARKSGELARVRHPQGGPCSVDGCTRDADAKGWCRLHYTRWLRHGSVADREPKLPAPCSECGAPGFRRGYCVKHYSRMVRHGSVDYVSRRADGAGTVTGNGYLVLTLPQHPLARKGGSVLAHRAALYDSIGPGPHPCAWCGVVLGWREGLTADHLDWDRLNNDPANLVPSCLPCNSTRQEHPQLGSRSPNAKITEADVREIRKAVGTHEAIAQRFGICRAQVTNIRLGRAWRHVS